MKKIVFTLLLLICTGCSTIETVPGEIRQTTKEELQTKIEKKESFVLLLTAKSCSGCMKLHEELETQLNEIPTIIYEVEIADMQGEREQLIEDFNQIKEIVPEFQGTPYYVYYENGEAKDPKNGYMKNEFIEWIKEHNLHKNSAYINTNIEE